MSEVVGYCCFHVVAAFDTEGERIAFISPSFTWVDSARDAEIFQSQVDASYFIQSKGLSNNSDTEMPKPANFDHVKPLFVSVSVTSPLRKSPAAQVIALAWMLAISPSI